VGRELMRVAIDMLSAAGGRRELMRIAIDMLSAAGRRRELMRVAIDMLSAAGGEEGAEGRQPEHAAAVLAPCV